jgi:hypothetical protein
LLAKGESALRRSEKRPDTQRHRLLDGHTPGTYSHIDIFSIFPTFLGCAPGATPAHPQSTGTITLGFLPRCRILINLPVIA